MTSVQQTWKPERAGGHHDGGDDACPVSLSVPRERIERLFIAYMASLELPRQLAEIEERWHCSRRMAVDHRPHIAELEMRRASLVAAIKSGGLVTELGAELKAMSGERGGIWRRLHVPVPDVLRVMASLCQPIGNRRRQRIVHEEFHAALTRGSWRSRTASAAKYKASSMSPVSKSGNAPRISVGVMPSAIISMTVATGMRSPRMQGTSPSASG